MTHNSSGWSASPSQTKISKTYTMDTKNKYLSDDIKMTINVNKIELDNGQTFQIVDPLNTWTWSVDASGNVLIY